MRFDDQRLLSPVTIHTQSLEALGGVYQFFAGGNPLISSAGSATWPSDALALYIPFTLGHPMLVTKLFWYNGATLGANADVGIFTFDGTKMLSSGAVAQSGTNAIQIADVTDTVIDPGAFFMGMSLSVATATNFRIASSGVYLMRALGCFEEAAASPLPANATFAAYASTYIPMFGISGLVTF